MNGVVIMRSLLMGYSPVTQIVGDQIYAGDVPESATLPAIGIREIGRIETDTVTRAEQNSLINARVQITVYATSYKEQKALLLASKLGAGVHAGTIAGVTVLNVLRDVVGPDLSNPEAGIFEQSRDFKVAYLEPNPA